MVAGGILVVSTGNRARGPAAAHLLSAEASRRDLEVSVASAGLKVGEWRGLLFSMTEAMATRGIAAQEHLARALDVDELRSNGLVVTMTEQQRRRVSRLDPSAIERCFTLRELTRLVSSPRWQSRWDGAQDVVPRLHALRPFVPPADDAEDIVDPARGGRRMARHVLNDVAAAVKRVSTPLFGPVPPRHS